MDPLSIATSAFALIGVCTTILAFVESRLDVDNRVKNACAEVKGLVKVLQSLDTLARDPGLKGIGHSSHPADDVGNWEMVKQTMNECKGTLDKLETVLQDVKSVLMPGIPIPQFPIRTVKFQLKSGEITQYKEQIGGYLRLIQICLQLITVSSMRRNESKIDSLVTALGDLGLNRSRTSSIGNTPPVIGQTAAPPLTPINPSNSQPAEFIQGLFSASNEDQCVSGRPLSDASTLRAIDFASDFEYEAIQQMRKTAFRSFVEKDYINAEPILQRILRKSEEKYLMDGFPWKDETILMLAKACWRISKFDDAGRLLEQRFEGRDRLMETLAKESLDLRKRSDAERILVQEFQGKEPVLDRLANSYLQDKKWKEAKSAFLDLMRYSADDNVRLQRMHTLAKICFALKQYKAAEEWCLLAVKGRQTTLGKRHHQFYDSVNLLTQICKAKGDHVEAKAYMAVLRDLPPGLQECVEIEQLTHDLEDPKHVKQALKKIGTEYFKSILTRDSKRTSIRENIKKADYKVTGSGRGWSLIHTLAESGRELAIQLLLEKGGDKEAASMDGTPLVIATAHNNPGTVKLLLERNANTGAMNEDGSTALNIAAIHGYEQCVQLLLNSGANPQWKPAVKKWNTPLIDAAMRGYESIVQLLLDKNADMDAESNIGSALVEATLGGSEGIVRLLLNKGANPNARARNMGTALNIAANNGYKGIVELLLGRGAHLEATDKNRKTPLMLAAEREDVEVVRLLLNSGARLDAKDINGLSALQCANRKPASRATSAMSDLHDTPTIRLLLSEIRSRMQRERRRISSRSTLGVN